MTKREKLIVSVYTGVLMCDFSEVHTYIEELLGRPAFTHELANPELISRLRDEVREEFMKICQETTPDLEENPPKTLIIFRTPIKQ